MTDLLPRMDGRLREAMTAVPRARFIPDRIWVYDGRWRPVDRGSDPQAWAEWVDSDEAITTQVDDGADVQTGELATSSSSVPSLMVTMIDALDLSEDSRVLEIGTGTGWNAALLSHLVGAEHVTTIEVDATLAEGAAAALSAVGCRPTVVIGDGALGHPACAPYDAIIATCAAQRVPYAWVEQTRPGGVIVVPWGTTYAHGGLVRLVVGEDGVAEGRFIAPAAFMLLRGQRPFGGSLRDYVHEHDQPDLSMTTLDPRAVCEDDDGEFAIGTRVHAQQRVFHADNDSGEFTLWLIDGTSWASVDYEPGASPFAVEQFGPRRLWDEVETACAWWLAAGKPCRERFGLTVSREDQRVFLD